MSVTNSEAAAYEGPPPSSKDWRMATDAARLAYFRHALYHLAQADDVPIGCDVTGAKRLELLQRKGPRAGVVWPTGERRLMYDLSRRQPGDQRTWCLRAPGTSQLRPTELLTIWTVTTWTVARREKNAQTGRLSTLLFGSQRR